MSQETHSRAQIRIYLGQTQSSLFPRCLTILPQNPAAVMRESHGLGNKCQLHMSEKRVLLPPQLLTYPLWSP